MIREMSDYKKNNPMEDDVHTLSTPLVQSRRPQAGKHKGNEISVRLEPRIVWILLWVVFGISVAASIYKFEFANAGTLILIIIASVYAYKWVVKQVYTEEINYYVVNLTNTTRAFLKNPIKLQGFYPHAKTLAWIGLAVNLFGLVIMRPFVYVPLSGTVTLFGLVLFLIGVTMLISNRQVRDGSQLLLISSLFQVLVVSFWTMTSGEILMEFIWFSLLQLVLGTYLNSVKIKNIQDWQS